MAAPCGTDAQRSSLTKGSVACEDSQSANVSALNSSGVAGCTHEDLDRGGRDRRNGRLC